MLHLESVHKSFSVGHNRLHVLKGIDLAVESGELVSIMGSSGSGKSTLLHILGLLDRHDAGEYRLDGTRIHELSETRAARLRGKLIGFVFQSFNLVPFKTAAENVALPMWAGISADEQEQVVACVRAAVAGRGATAGARTG